MSRLVVMAATVIFLALGTATPAHAEATVVARLDSPVNGASVDGVVVVRGSAHSAPGEAGARRFNFYKLEFAGESTQQRFVVIGDLHYQPVTDGVLGMWDTRCLPYGAYELRLTVVDQTSNYLQDEVLVATAPPWLKQEACPVAVGDWVHNTAPAGLWSGPDGGAVLFNVLPAGAGYFQVTGPAQNGKVPVYYPGDDHGGVPGPAWVDLDRVHSSGPPSAIPIRLQ